MNAVMPRGEIKEAVSGFTKVINGKQTIPILGCVRLRAEETGIVAQATDLDQVLEYRFSDAQVHGKVECILPLSALKDLSKGSKIDDVEFDAQDPLRIGVTNHVGGHAVSQTVAGMDLDEWPVLHGDVATKPAEGFLDTYRRLVPFSSTDETRYVLNSVFVEVGKGENPVTMAATDGRRLACWNSMALPLKKSIVVPTTKFLAWPKLPENVEIGVRKDDDQVWLGVKAGAFSYSVKCVDGRYPNFRQVIPATPGENVITFADSDVDLLKKVLTTFPGDEDLTLVGNDGKVTLYGRGPDDESWTTLTLEDTTYEGERKFIGLNRHFLLDALTVGGFREFAITDELCPVLSRDGQGGTHVLMPMRVQDPVETGEVAEVEQAVEAPAPPVEPAPKPESKAENVKPKKRRNKVTKQNEEKNDAPALDRVLVACDVARAKVKEAAQSLTELGSAIRDAAREQKTQTKEVEAAKAAIKKVQSLKLAA